VSQLDALAQLNLKFKTNIPEMRRKTMLNKKKKDENLDETA